MYLRQVAADRLKLLVVSKDENFYLKRAGHQETEKVIVKELQNKGRGTKTMQTKCFPTVESNSTPENLKLNMSFTLA